MTVARRRIAALAGLMALVACGTAEEQQATRPEARQVVETPFAVAPVGEDRSRIVLHAAGLAGSCTEDAAAQVQETATGLEVKVTVSVPAASADERTAGGTPKLCSSNVPVIRLSVALPRPLAPAEEVEGSCEPSVGSREGELCRQMIESTLLPA